MKILVLSFYYPPDLSAGSFRIVGLVKGLIDRGGHDVEIEVITTLPNRYKGFVTTADISENQNHLKIHRVKIPKHNSGMLDQAKSFLFYAYEVQKLVKKQKYDLVFATSGRLMTAVLGALLSRWKNIPLFLDIRDIFLDTLQEVLPKNAALILTPIFSSAEKFAIRRASCINLVSPGFESYFKNKYPNKSLTYYMNGIDEEFLLNGNEANYAEIKPCPEVMTILYGGNIGEGQGLHKIIPLLATKLGTKVCIKVVGGGGRLKQLQAALKLADVKNVVIIPPMIRGDLIREYLKADVLFLHLNNYVAFEKVLPSKIFEYAATGKPILAGVSGYAEKFLRDEVSNAEVFKPCDADDAIEALSKLSLQDVRRENFIKKYSRKNIMKNFSKEVFSIFWK